MAFPVATSKDPPPPDPSSAASASALPAFFQRIARYDREFVVYDDGWREWKHSYGDMARMAGAFSARLRDHGLRKGDSVLIWSESRPGWIAALWGCLLEGVVLVPVEPQASASLFHRIEQQVKPRAILLGELPRFEAGELAGSEQAGEVPVWSLRDVEADLSASTLEPIALGEGDVAEIIFTSGTTAEPKGVLMTHRNLAACLAPLEDQLAPYRKYFHLLAPLRVLDLLPMSHLFGQVLAVFVIPLVPGSVVFLSSNNPEEIARHIRAKKICALISVPKMLEVMRDFVLHRFPETKDASSAQGHWIRRWWRFRKVHRLFGWRFCCFVVGGAPLPPEIEQFWSRLGFVVAQGYGLTETAPIISFNHPFHAEKGTAGRLMAGVRIKLADDGEVLVRGDNVTPGYFQLASETAAAFQDGWLRTGDIGELTPKGDLIIRGRKKDVIVTPDGLNVFPEDVEGVLNTVDGVQESAVLDQDGVHAVLVLKPGFKGEDILREANQRLETHQRIRSFSLWSQGPLPRTATTQKLRRAALVAALRTGAREKPAATSNPLVDLVAKYAPGRTVTPDTSLEELGLSSLDRVELMLDLEEKLAIDIDDRAFSSIRKVSELAQPVELAEPIPQPAYNRSWIARLIRRILLPTIFLPLTRLFARITVAGGQNLRAVKGPVLFAANHQSYFDAPAILASLPGNWRYRIAPAMWMEFFDAHFHPDRYTLRQRCWKSSVYRLLTVLFNAFPLSQVETGTRQSLRYMGELVDQGWSILIFPEGERTLTGDIGVFHSGAAMIASRMRLPVVPIHLVGLDQVLHRGSAWPRRGRVEVRIGAPIVLQGESYEALAQQIEAAVRSL